MSAATNRPSQQRRYRHKRAVCRAATRIIDCMTADGVTKFAHTDTPSGEETPLALVIAVTEEDAAEVYRLVQPWLRRRMGPLVRDTSLAPCPPPPVGIAPPSPESAPTTSSNDMEG